MKISTAFCSSISKFVNFSLTASKWELKLLICALICLILNTKQKNAMRYIIFFLFINFFFYGQNRIDIPVQLYKELNKNINLDEYIGSVYLFEKFNKANFYLGEEIEEIYANYNVYRNKFTFKQLDGSEYELNFEEGLKIEIKDKLFDFVKFKDEEIIGIELASNLKNKLYKVYKTIIIPPKPSSYGYDLPKPGKINIENFYYIIYNNNLYMLEDSKKSVLDLFPNYKSLIKKNKLKFKKEEDFINFFKLLNSK